MRLCHTDRGACVAWSPLSGDNAHYLATGTVAGTIGLDFDTSAFLELFRLPSQTESGSQNELQLVGKCSAPDRLNKLCWSPTKLDRGIIAGAVDNGMVSLWDASKLWNSDENTNALIANCERHKAAAIALDFHHFQHHLLASGASDGEVFIWDLQNPSKPNVYHPGANPARNEAGVTALAWNISSSAQHILASCLANGVTQVWDLRAKRVAISFSDPTKKLRSRAVAWNPLEPRQIVTASEDDSSPVLQLWDLRNAYSPSKTLQGHSEGIHSISWCPHDPNLLASSGKDGKTLLWNMNLGTPQCEIDSGRYGWNFEVKWSPSLQAILSTATRDGRVQVHSVTDLHNIQEDASKDEDPSGLGIGVASPKASAEFAPSLEHPPKWLKRPCGVSFGFGGKIVSFGGNKKTGEKQQQTVRLHHVVTEKEILDRADKLEAINTTDDAVKFCEERIAETEDSNEKSTWVVLKALFQSKQRVHILRFLGFDTQEILKSLKKFAGEHVPEDQTEQAISEESQDATKPAAEESVLERPVDDAVQEETSEPNQDPFGAPTEGQDEDFFSKLGEAAAAEKPEPNNDNNSGSEEPASPAAEKAEDDVNNKPPITFASDGDEGMITQSILIGNLPYAVKCALKADKFADALILAFMGDSALWQSTIKEYFARINSPLTMLLECIINDDLHQLVKRVDLNQWKSALGVVCTYAKPMHFPVLCSSLGDRLRGADMKNSAVLCYICAGNIDKVVDIWSDLPQNNQPIHHLQALIEKVTILRRAINSHEPLGTRLGHQYSEYAKLLASQGRVSNALHSLRFLSETDTKDVTTEPFVLLHRLYYANSNPTPPPPPYPFTNAQQIKPISNAKPAKPSTTTPSYFEQPPAFTPPSQPMANQPFQQQPLATQQPFPGTASQQPLPTPSEAPRQPLAQPFTPPVVSNAPPSQPLQRSSQPPPSQPFSQPPPSQPFSQPPPAQEPPATKPPMPASKEDFASQLAPPPLAAQTSSAPPTKSSPVAARKEPAPKPAGPPSAAASQLSQRLKLFLDAASQNSNPKAQRLYKDTRDRLEPFRTRLDNSLFNNEAAVADVAKFFEILSTDPAAALDHYQRVLTKTHWNQIGDKIMVGLKRCVDIQKLS